MPSSVANILQSGQAVPAAVRAYFLETACRSTRAPQPPAVRSGGRLPITCSSSVLNPGCIGRFPRCVVCYGGRLPVAELPFLADRLLSPTTVLIASDDGTRKSFGASRRTTAGLPHGGRNSIAWEVWWGVNGIPVWTAQAA